MPFIFTDSSLFLSWKIIWIVISAAIILYFIIKAMVRFMRSYLPINKWAPVGDTRVMISRVPNTQYPRPKIVPSAKLAISHAKSSLISGVSPAKLVSSMLYSGDINHKMTMLTTNAFQEAMVQLDHKYESWRLYGHGSSPFNGLWPIVEDDIPVTLVWDGSGFKPY